MCLSAAPHGCRSEREVLTLTCDVVPNCMDLITTDMVEAAVERQLSAAVWAQQDCPEELVEPLHGGI
jgi:hypothetical protein